MLVISTTRQYFKLDGTSEVLEGASETLRHEHPPILLEAWTARWYAEQRQRLIDQLKALGYGVFPVRSYPFMLLASVG